MRRFLPLILIALLLLLLFLPKREVSEEEFMSSRQIKELKEELTRRFKETPPEVLYEEIKNQKTENVVLPHIAAHIFGELLYTKYGVSGVTFCDEGLVYGCYHGFFDKAIADKGMEVLSELNKACIDKFGERYFGCQHGIGHGIAEYMGEERLTGSLSLCERIGAASLPFGCFGGVFMEYNFPAMYEVLKGKEPIREYSERVGAYEPCTSIPAEYRPVCYFRLTEWWEVVFEKDYRRMGEFCQGLTGKEGEACFLGIGAGAPVTNKYSVEETLEVCRLMPSSEGQLICKNGAYWVFSASGRKPLAEEICAGIPSEEEKVCREGDFLGIQGLVL